MDPTLSLHKTSVHGQLKECISSKSLKNDMLNENLTSFKDLYNEDNKDWLRIWNNHLENPFTKYGVLPSKIKGRDRRKTHSAPLLSDFCSDRKYGRLGFDKEHVSDKIDQGSHKITSDFLKVGEDEKYNKIEKIETTILEDENQKLHHLETVTDNESTCTEGYKFSDSFERYNMYSGGFDGMNSPKDHSGILEDLSPLDSLMERLCDRTKNAFFSTNRCNGSLGQKWRNHPKIKIDEEFVNAALHENDEAHICSNLFYELDSIVNKEYADELFTPEKTTKDLEKIKISKTSAKSTWNQSGGEISKEDELLWSASTKSAQDAMRKVGTIGPHCLKPYDMNDDFMLTDAEDYAVLQTRFGRIIYSPKLRDGQFMYRFVILTKEAQEAVEKMSKTRLGHSKGHEVEKVSGKRFLTEYEIIKDLGIQMSMGWEHFLYFKNAHRELILRKRI